MYQTDFQTHPETVYSEEDFASIDPACIPKHVGVIMDGNRRWAKKFDYPIQMGHWQGAKQLDCIIQASMELGIRVVTAYAFSTENWSRSSFEVKVLMKFLEGYLKGKRKQLVVEGVKLSAIGDLSGLPTNVSNALHQTIEATEKCCKLDLVIAVNYGSRNEITRCVKKIVNEVRLGSLKEEELSENIISSFLDTHRWPDPDVIVRTSGENRNSNFLAWQGVYSEMIVSNVLWPEFTEIDFLKAILEYQQRKRRFGK